MESEQWRYRSRRVEWLVEDGLRDLQARYCFIVNSVHAGQDCVGLIPRSTCQIRYFEILGLDRNCRVEKKAYLFPNDPMLEINATSVDF
jgi:hypothetical protein